MLIDNLKEALQGEAEAQFKYRLFAEKAKQEGFPEVAHLFIAVAYAESRHIKNHLRALNVLKNGEYSLEDIVDVDEEKVKNKIKDTPSNLRDAIDGEIYETKTMYKKFEKNASKEGLTVPELSFSLAREAEKVHAKLFSRYLKKLNKGKKIQNKKIYVCNICGNVEFIDVPDICPVCDHSKHFYREIPYE